MSRAKRRASFLIGFLVALYGSFVSAGPAVALGVFLVLISLLPSRTDSASNETKAGALVEANGVIWMPQPNGLWLRWNEEGRAWEDVGPPPPEVVRRRESQPRSSTTLYAGSRIAAIAAAIIGSAGLWALLDPHAQIPGVSQVVCSLKGGTWFEGSQFGAPAGCYSRDPP